AIGRLNESPADIVITNDAKVEWNAAFLRITNRGGDAGIRHRYNNVGFDRVFAREFDADVLAHLVNRTAFDHRIGTREVNIFENAEFRFCRRKGVQTLDALAVDDDE